MEPEPEPSEEEADLLRGHVAGPEDVAAKYPLNPETCYYTMYVVASPALKKLPRLPHHEDALAKGLLTEVVRVEDGKYSNKKLFLRQDAGGELKEISDEHLYFFSHRWMSPSLDPELAHPDDKHNTKLLAMKRIVGPQKYCWLDYMCVPQRNPEAQLRAIQSLPFYSHCAGRFTALVYGAQGKAEYLERMWCQAELVASKLPLRMRAWHPRRMISEGRFYDMSAESSGHESRLTPIPLSLLRNPASCTLTVASDAAKLRPLYAFAAHEFQALLDFDASPTRAKTKEFGTGALAIDDDPQCKQVVAAPHLTKQKQANTMGGADASQASQQVDISRAVLQDLQRKLADGCDALAARS